MILPYIQGSPDVEQSDQCNVMQQKYSRVLTW